MENRKYPIGKFEYGKSYNFQEIRKNIERISKLPKLLKKAVKKAKSVDLDKKYRPGGWTARQVIHHLADSHINAYIRFKLAATETNPTIRPYDEKKWALLNDGADAGVKMSIALIAALHKRMSYFLESLTEADFQRTFFHPGSGRTFTLGEAVALYAWHGKHHVRHIELAVGGEKVEDALDENEPTVTKPDTKSEKRKAGRPAKTAKVDNAAAPKRKAGRPAKPKAEVADAAAPKRKAGRPAKPKAEVADAAAPKRKAGRPAKPKAEVADVAAPKRKAGGRPAKPKAEAANTAAPKRKAGRPAKPKAEVTDAAAPTRKAGRPAKLKTEVVTDAAAPKRKAGRPAKPKADVANAAAPKRKPGRPKAIKVEDVTVIAIDSVSSTPPKRRGRPPVKK